MTNRKCGIVLMLNFGKGHFRIALLSQKVFNMVMVFDFMVVSIFRNWIGLLRICFVPLERGARHSIAPSGDGQIMIGI